MAEDDNDDENMDGDACASSLSFDSSLPSSHTVSNSLSIDLFFMGSQGIFA